MGAGAGAGAWAVDCDGGAAPFDVEGGAPRDAWWPAGDELSPENAANPERAKNSVTMSSAPMMVQPPIARIGLLERSSGTRPRTPQAFMARTTIASGSRPRRPRMGLLGACTIQAAPTRQPSPIRIGFQRLRRGRASLLAGVGGGLGGCPRVDPAPGERA